MQIAPVVKRDFSLPSLHKLVFAEYGVGGYRRRCSSCCRLQRQRSYPPWCRRSQLHPPEEFEQSTPPQTVSSDPWHPCALSAT